MDEWGGRLQRVSVGRWREGRVKGLCSWGGGGLWEVVDSGM